MKFIGLIFLSEYNICLAKSERDYRITDPNLRSDAISKTINLNYFLR